MECCGCPGLPRECWQAAYDAALFQAFRCDDRGGGGAPLPQSGAPRPQMLRIQQPRTPEEWFALRLRAVSERGADARLQLQSLVRAPAPPPSSTIARRLASGPFQSQPRAPSTHLICAAQAASAWEWFKRAGLLCVPPGLLPLHAAMCYIAAQAPQARASWLGRLSWRAACREQ